MKKSTQVLLNLSKKVNKFIKDNKEKLPKDLSINHDKYLYKGGGEQNANRCQYKSN